MGEESIMKKETAVLSCLGLIVAVPLSAIMRAFVLVTMWKWFVTPTWNVTAPTPVVAYGLTLLIGMLVPSQSSVSDPTDTPKDKIQQSFGALLLGPLLILALAWLVQRFA